MPSQHGSDSLSCWNNSCSFKLDFRHVSRLGGLREHVRSKNGAQGVLGAEPGGRRGFLRRRR